MSDQTRLSVNINAQCAGLIREYSERHGVSFTETVRRLVASGGIILGEIDSGATLVIKRHGQRDQIAGFEFS